MRGRLVEERQAAGNRTKNAREKGLSRVSIRSNVISNILLLQLKQGNCSVANIKFRYNSQLMK